MEREDFAKEHETRCGAKLVHEDMPKALIAILLVAVAAFAENVKLYLKNGDYHLVSQYQVQTDRVRFYSVERSQWEEIPLDLVDLKRTEAEKAEHQAQRAAENKAAAEEEGAERAARAEIAKIPKDPGVYYMQGDTVKVLPAAESKLVTNKARSVLKVLTPVPIVTGKATLLVDGEHSKNAIANPEQEFYLQIAAEERFGIVKLTPDRGARIVERVTVAPTTKDVLEQPIEVQVFRKQMTQDGLYKLWPVKPMPPGEYAVVEYTAGKTNMQVWDFAVR